MRYLAKRTGMGWPNPSTLPSGVLEDWQTISGNGRSGDGAPPWWAILGPSIITSAGQVTRDIFAPVGTSQAAYGAKRPIVQQNYDSRTNSRNTEDGIGAGLERFVRENSTLLLVGAGLLVLIQMPGFTRRGR